MCFVRSVYTEIPNHEPALEMMNTGANFSGRPSMGSWLTYGLGSMNENLPTYVVLHSKVSSNKPNQAVYPRLWGTGFLPSEYQGVALRSQGDPVLFLKDPDGMLIRQTENVNSGRQIRFSSLNDVDSPRAPHKA